MALIPCAVVARQTDLFTTIVHTNHGMPDDIAANFRDRGPAWCDGQLSGSSQLLARYDISLPTEVEHHDLSEAARVTGWQPRFGIIPYLQDLQRRDAGGEDVRSLWAPGQTPE